MLLQSVPHVLSNPPIQFQIQNQNQTTTKHSSACEREKRKKKENKIRKEAAGKRRATLCMYGFVGDFKLKLVNGVGDGDDGIATREASREYTKHARRAVTQ